MILQNIVFPESNVCTIIDTYFRLDSDKDYSFERNDIKLDCDKKAYFDTYHNGFYLNKWKKYTNIEKIVLTLRLKGSFRIRLLHVERLLNKRCKYTILDEIEFRSKLEEFVQLPYPDYSTGMLTFELLSLEDGSLFCGGHYSSDISSEYVREVTLGLCICTYKREQYVMNNVNRIVKLLTEDVTSALSSHLRVYIADNGGTLDFDAFNPSYVRLYRNKNTGGAGGFTRCMIEAISDEDISHVVLMDDDIIFDVESIYRTFALFSIIKDDYHNSIIGGAMFSLDEPNIQIESGAIWNKGNMIPLKRRLDLTSCESCLYNDLEESADYNAWWYCAIPVEKIIKNGLPLPIFFKGDDVEYGLRNIENLILLNGICVWHEPFEKKYSSSVYYYSLRNRLIINSIHGIGYTKKRLIKEYLKQWSREMTCYRYKNASLLSKSVEDFLRGITWLENKDGEVLHNEIMSLGYKLESISDIRFNFLYREFIKDPNNKESYPWFINLILPTDKDSTVEVYRPDIRKFNRAKNVLNYDYHSQKAFLTVKNWKLAAIEVKTMMKISISIIKEYEHRKKEYRSRGDEITSLEFWKDYLELHGGN